MWYAPESKKVESLNEQLLSLKGTLENKEAKISLAKFLRANLGLTVDLIAGIKLAPFQEITLKGMLNRNFSMCVWGRGCGKTFIASVFCFLQCIFEPGTKILIAGPTFRTARFIFENLEPNLITTPFTPPSLINKLEQAPITKKSTLSIFIFLKNLTKSSLSFGININSAGPPTLNQAILDSG